MSKWENKIVCGKNPGALKPIPSESMSCIMFSPPYLWLRDYKVEGQIGLEKDFNEYLAKMWLIFDELWRVLRTDGTMWVNLGDGYGTHASKRSGQFGKEIKEFDEVFTRSRKTGHEKSLLMLPERLMLGLLDRGWILRNKCIWQKPNPMPCSAKDRFTTTWEYLFFLTKNTKLLWFYNTKTRKAVDRKPPPEKLQKKRDWIWKDEYKRKKISLWRSYSGFFDLDAVRRPHKESSYQRIQNPIKAETMYKDNPGYHKQDRSDHTWLDPAGKNPGDVITTKIHQEDAEKMGSPRARQHRRPDEKRLHTFYGHSKRGKEFENPAGANPGDFWSIPTQPSKLAHYASYPEKLCETPLKAGCPRWICKECGMARVRVTKTGNLTGRCNGDGKHLILPKDKIAEKTNQRRYNTEKFKPNFRYEYSTLGWSFCSCLCPACGEADCKCGEKWRPGIVLDPFVGIGTTCIVAKKLGLSYLGIDIKPEYCEMAEKRLKDVRYQEVFDYG